MKKILFVSVIILLDFTIALGQITFQKTYSGNSFLLTVSLAKIKDGRYVIVGTTNEGQGNKVYTLITDSAGVLQGTSSDGLNNTDEQGYYVNATRDGGYIITGYFDNDLSGQKAMLMKVGGNTGWTKSYGVKAGSVGYNETGYYVLQTADNGYMVVGDTPGGLYLFKTDSMGTQQWSRRIRNVSSTFIQQTADGNYVTVGTVTVGSTKSIYISKITLNGSMLWEKYIPNAATYYSNTFQETSDKGFIIVGSINKAASLIKTDSAANYQWAKTYTLSDTISLSSVIQTSDGGFAFTGNNKPFQHMLLFKTAADGSAQWAKTYGYSSTYSNAVLQTSDKGYVINGYTNSEGYLVKTDSLGNSGCNDSTLNPTVSSPSLTTTVGHTTIDTLGADSTIYFTGGGGGLENVICYQVSGINKVVQQNSVSVYPNPASSEFTINANTDDKLIMDLYDVNGKHVFTKTGYGKSTIDVLNLNAGVYTLTIKLVNQVLNKKLVIFR